MPSGRGDFLAEELANRPAVDAAHELADQVPVGQRVIAVGGPRFPPGRFVGERGRHRRPVVEGLARQRLADPRQPRGVAEEVARRDRLLAVRGELGPVARDRRVDVELAAIDQHVRAQRGDRLGGREDVDDRVLLSTAACARRRRRRPTGRPRARRRASRRTTPRPRARRRSWRRTRRGPRRSAAGRFRRSAPAKPNHRRAADATPRDRRACRPISRRMDMTADRVQAREPRAAVGGRSRAGREVRLPPSELAGLETRAPWRRSPGSDCDSAGRSPDFLWVHLGGSVTLRRVGQGEPAQGGMRCAPRRPLPSHRCWCC